MIRLKSKDADLKRTYARDLCASAGFAVLLLAAVVAIDPQIAFDERRLVQRPVTIEIELVPETEMRLPLPPPPVQHVEPVAYVRTRPVREHKLPPPVVVTEFPLEEEVEAAELWMVEQPPKVLKKVLPSLSRQCAESTGRGQGLCAGTGGSKGTGRAHRPPRGTAGLPSRGSAGRQGLGSSRRLCRTTAPSQCGSACRLCSSWSNQPPARLV